MANKGNKGIAKLANVVDERIKEHTDTPLLLDFGTIGPNYTLTTNTFPKPMPAKDYSVCRQLSLGNIGDTLCGVTSGGVAVIPEKMRKLRTGDHVLVAWVQDEPVVIDIIMKASSL